MISYINQGTEKFDNRYWVEKDRKAEFPSEFLKSIQELGLTTLFLPEEYGGSGLSVSDYVRIVKHVSSIHGVAAGDLVMAHNVFGAYSIASLGNEHQKEKFLPRVAKNEVISSIAITEPNAGTDTLNISTHAERANGKLVLSGRKIWITMAHMSDLMLVLARTSKESTKSTKGLTLFAIDPKEHKNITSSRIDDIALRSLGSCEVFFDNVELSEDDILGEEGKGWRALTGILNLERLSTASISMGTGELVLNLATQYAKDRKLFGRQLGSNQSIQFPLAHGRIMLEASWRLIDEAARKRDSGEDGMFEANAAAYLSAKSAYEIADHAMQVFGGMSFSIDMGVELHWRNLRLFRVGPVSEQMTLSLIARHSLGLPPSF
ncbi:hypothetical protein IX51_02965 [uncultured archaeon]|nr:hypothetical protein IX51_02965 [uncultured archaeon]